jgi:polypeptide N-acetylgalactosaminyltransferase
MSDDNCLDASNIVGPVSLIRCHGLEGNQAWVYDSKVNSLNTLDSIDML